MNEDAPRAPNAKVREDDARGTPPGAGQIVPAHGGRIGNPPFVPTDDQRLKVRAYAKTFPPAAENFIARLMGFSIMTLRRHFAEDMELGRAEMLAAIGAQVINRAMNADAVGPDGKPLARGDQKDQHYILARLGGWSVKAEISGPGGGPIETVDLSKLNADQLEQYGRLAAIAAGIDPDTIIAVPR